MRQKRRIRKAPQPASPRARQLSAKDKALRSLHDPAAVPEEDDVWREHIEQPLQVTCLYGPLERPECVSRLRWGYHHARTAGGERGAAHRERQPDERGAVLVEHRLHRRVVAATQVGPKPQAVARLLGAHLPDRLPQRDRLQHGAHREHREADDRVAVVRRAPEQRADALVEREQRARREDAHGGQQRPEEPLLAVTEGVPPVGGAKGNRRCPAKARMAMSLVNSVAPITQAASTRSVSGRHNRPCCTSATPPTTATA